MIKRDLTPKLRVAARTSPSITLTGPRQSGKTTLCQAVFSQHPYATLEAPDIRAFAAEDPRAFLAQFPDGAIIDEVQRLPDLLSYLQGVIDADPAPGRWILTGSQNLSLLESVSQSLAGRTAVYNLLPLTRGEIERFPQHPKRLEETLLSGAYPRIFDHKLDPSDWLRSYVATYVERDVRTISNVGDLATFQRFVELCAGRTAQLVNYSSLADDCGVSQPSAKAWLSILETNFLTFRLPAFHSNLRKRLVKMPKLHFYDTGLVCWLLGIRTAEQLRTHPLRGPIFETWVVSEIAKYRTNRGETGGLSFYRDRNGAEADLIIEHPSRTTLVEAKSAETASSGLFDTTRRVRRYLTQSPRPCSVVVAYGGDQIQHRAAGSLMPWHKLHEAGFWESAPVVSVFAAGQPIAGASVLALFPDETFMGPMTTDEGGEARLDMPSAQRPMTVFVAAEGFAARVEHHWIPAERTLAVELEALSEGGSAVFPEERGRVPGLEESVTFSRDQHERTWIASKNIAINGKNRSMAAFEIGEEMCLSSRGQEVFVRVVDLLGRSVLVQYRRASESRPNGSPA